MEHLLDRKMALKSIEFQKWRDKLKNLPKPNDDFSNLTTKQNTSLEIRKLDINVNKNIHKLEHNDDKYSFLMCKLMFNKKFLYIINEDSKIWIEYFKQNPKWLQSISNANKEFGCIKEHKNTENLKKFILRFEFCIRADINNIKQILNPNGKRLTRKHLNQFSSKFGFPIFEAPVNHMIRTWKLNTVNYIYHKYPEFSKDIMNNKNTLNRKILMDIHSSLYKTCFSDKVYQRYFMHFENKNKAVVKDLQTIINYVKSNNLKYYDLYDENFDINNFEHLLIGYKLPMKKSISIASSNFESNKNETCPSKHIEKKGVFKIKDEKIEFLDEKIEALPLSSECAKGETPLKVKKEITEETPFAEFEDKIEDFYHIRKKIKLEPGDIDNNNETL